jgi:hypothetical protein
LSGQHFYLLPEPEEDLDPPEELPPELLEPPELTPELLDTPELLVPTDDDDLDGLLLL